MRIAQWIFYLGGGITSAIVGLLIWFTDYQPSRFGQGLAYFYMAGVLIFWFREARKESK